MGSFTLQLDSERPVLVDKYLDRADELDVDALCDKDGNVTITGIMQHIEQVLAPPRTFSHSRMSAKVGTKGLCRMASPSGAREPAREHIAAWS